MNLTLFQLSKELNICMGESPMNDFSGFYRRVPGIRQQQGKNSELGQVHLQAAAFDKSSVLLLIFLQLFLEPWQSPFRKQMHYCRFAIYFSFIFCLSKYFLHFRFLRQLVILQSDCKKHGARELKEKPNTGCHRKDSGS